MRTRSAKTSPASRDRRRPDRELRAARNMPQLGTTPKSPKEFGSAEANTPNSALAMVFRA
ncbi:MAG: hypothetical protein HYX38_14980 [Rhodospirillales bacterium]|nr:hypothetical protein [Rhodospirillales bacterium]